MDLGKLEELSEHRVCRECGAEFWTETVGGERRTALEQYADHSTEHQPTVAQWAEAYSRIQEGKRKAKGSQ